MLLLPLISLCDHQMHCETYFRRLTTYDYLHSSDAILLESEGALNSSPSSSFAAFKMETQLQVHHQLMKGRSLFNSILFGFCFCFFSFIFDDKFKTFAVRSRVQTQKNQRQHHIFMKNATSR